MCAVPLLLLAGCEQGPMELQGTAPAPRPALAAKAVEPASEDYRLRREGLDREAYQHLEDNPVRRVAEHPVSTFSVDVDSGAYSNVRRFLKSGELPPKDAVRIEELVNYFTYDYPPLDDPQTPFSVTTEAGPTPWNPGTYLLQIGIKGYDVARDERPPANLVFLVDVSGSMQPENKLPLLVNALKLLTRQLTASDRVSLVVYAGAAGVVLEPTPGDQKSKILSALQRLRAGGRTAGEAGLKLAYDVAEQGRIEGGINRVLLATDGDFNVGVADVEALKGLVERKRDSGITLTTLGFGVGNYNEALMEQIADVGNGNYAYIDELAEARKVLVREMASTLFTIAKDVKVQIEFNPAVVAEYRLIGYENRVLAREDFRNDRVDAGDIGAGHTVTALYEIALVGGAGARIDPLRYGGAAAQPGAPEELAFVKLRYKAPDGGNSALIERPIMRSLLEHEPSENFRFAAAVAAFGQLLRGGRYTEGFGYADVLSLARGARGEDAFGDRSGFLSLVQLAESLAGW